MRRSKWLAVFVLFACFLSTFAGGAEMYQRVEYNGKQYDYNTRIRTIMYAGVDSDELLETYDRYSIAPRADAIELILLDGYTKAIKVLAISRDTMTAIRRYTMDGTDRGMYVSHLGYAYTFGDGGKLSCLNLAEAVSALLSGLPIHEYVITNEGGIEMGNAMIGGVEVVVPNNDLVLIHPEMVKGAVVFLTDENVHDFTAYRDITIPFTNGGRMERQRAYTRAYVAKLRQVIKKSPEMLWNQIEAKSSYIQTSISRSQFLKIAEEISQYTFTPEDYYVLGGEDVIGEYHDELWLEADEVTQMVLALFYHEAE